MTDVTQLKLKWEAVRSTLHERSRRLWAGAEARAIGWGGVKLVHETTGLAPSTIIKGKRELEASVDAADDSARVRAPGGGRPSATAAQPGLLAELEKCLEPVTRGDPESPLRWTAKSTGSLAAELSANGFSVSARTVGKLLKQQGYSLQSNRKRLEGKQHADRDAQFHYLSARAVEQVAFGNPAISVDTKKKELVGNYKNGGTTWRPKGQPIDVNVHDFKGELGRVSPYGIFDMFANDGWVNVGVSADTAEFAVESIRRWWHGAGAERYPDADELLITADCGGSNGYRLRLWKHELQRLANQIGIAITVCHLPPGTSKWNKIEHRLFAFIAKNWRGTPLTDYATVIKLISSTKNSSGLTVQAELDTNTYARGRKITDAQMAKLCLDPHAFHPEWNYTIHPDVSLLDTPPAPS